MADKPIQKISHKDVSSMSTAEFLTNSKVIYKRLLGYVKPYKSRFFMGVFFGVVAGLFNAVLLFTLRAVFKIVLNTGDPEKAIKPFEGLKVPEFLAWLEKVEFVPPPFIAEHDYLFVAFACALIPLMILIKGLLTYLHQYCMMWVGNKVLYQLRDECFSSLVNQSLKFYNRAKQGELMQTVFNQTRMASSAGSEMASSLIKHPVAILTTFAVLMTMDPIYTFGAMVVFPLCILPVLFISKKVRKAGGKEEEEAGQLMVNMQETFAGIRVVKSHAREEHERDKFNRASERMLAFIMRWRKAMEIVGPLVETVASIGIAAGLVYAKITDISPGEFLLMNMALMSMYPPAKALGRVQVQLQKCVIATSKVFGIIDMVPDVKDYEHAHHIDSKTAKGAIKFEGVTFGYVPGVPAVEDINLEFEPGKNYALVGKSGSGKSTMLSLIMRFYDPDAGIIRFDNLVIHKAFQRDLRDQIGMVIQETFLFHDTLYNNIRYGRLDATREEIEAAAKKAHAHDFIMEKSDGYETIIGDKGSQLSGGQQQRIAIARAILRDAPVLLLDEAYSALDSEAEKNIHEALEILSEGKTVIAIAHRLSTILNADCIIVMKDGQVEGMGTHEELLKTSEEYQLLYNLQFHGHEAEALS